MKEADLDGTSWSRVAASRHIALNIGSLSFVSFSLVVTRGWNHGIFHCRHGHDSRSSMSLLECSEVGDPHTDHKRGLVLLVVAPYVPACKKDSLIVSQRPYFCTSACILHLINDMIMAYMVKRAKKANTHGVPMKMMRTVKHGLRLLSPTPYPERCMWETNAKYPLRR